VESWQDRQRREAGEMDAAVRAALQLQDNAACRAELERLADKPMFRGFTWLWAPAVIQRDRVMFRPVVLSLFHRDATNRDGRAFDPWTGATAAALERLLADADAADDVELTRRLYTWRLESHRDRDRWWRADVIARFARATSATARATVLGKVDPGGWISIDPATALALWDIDRVASKAFILGHLPWRADLPGWRPLLDRSRDADADFHFALYRKIVDERAWAADLSSLSTSAALDTELERRHPSRFRPDAGVFHALLDKHGAAAVPYVRRHAGDIMPSWSYGRQREGKGLPDLLELVDERGWLDLWATLLRTSATRELFDQTVAGLLRAGNVKRLATLPGRGREWHGAGWSTAQVHALGDATACQLYKAYPALVRGPYRIHVAPTYGACFPKLIAAACAARDVELTDFLASRVIAVGYHDASSREAVDALVAHYEALAEDAFVPRAAAALSRLPARQIWSYDQLVAQNPLAKLLFERSTARFLGDGAAVRDLLESPEIYVQLLGFRVLAQPDPRAAVLAAANTDLLQAALFRRLRATSRRLAIAALRVAASHDEATARYLLGRMRDALALPEARYPVDELVLAIAALLARWPGLRDAGEQPVVYRARDGVGS
jgi:hypothetical protein